MNLRQSIDKMDDKEIPIQDVIDYLEEQYKEELNQTPLLLTGKELKECKKEFGYKVLGYGERLHPVTNKMETTQKYGWDATESFIRDMVPKERESAEEDHKNGDTEEYIQLNMPKSYWERLIYYVKTSIVEDDIKAIMKKIKAGEIKIDSLSPLAQQKVEYILKYKQSQYVIIIPCDKAAGMGEEDLKKKYQLNIFKAKNKKRENRGEFWIKCSNITFYFCLSLKILTDIAEAEPERRTLEFIKEIGSLHMNITTDQLNQRIKNSFGSVDNQGDKNCDQDNNSQQNQIKKQLLHSAVDYLEEKNSKDEDFDTDDNDEISESSKQQKHRKLSTECSQQETNNLMMTNETSVEQSSKTPLENIPILNENNLDNKNQMQMSSSLKKKIVKNKAQEIIPINHADSIVTCRLMLEKCKEEGESDFFQNLIVRQEQLIKIHRLGLNKKYVRGKKIRDFDWVFSTHSSIYDSFTSMKVDNPSNDSQSATEKREKIKKRCSKHFPINYFSKYLQECLE